VIRASVIVLFYTLGITACGGGSGGNNAPNGIPPDPSLATFIATEEGASRFLARASFGGSTQNIENLVGGDAAEWLSIEFNKSPTLYLDRVLQARDSDGDFPSRAPSDLYWQATIGSNDQLRQRMVFALSQILVISHDVNNREDSFAAYMDVLSRNAFGNYRDLLEEVTYSPIMAESLTYLRNRKGNPNTGRMPDENYAREVMQLMSIGLLELNPDATLRLDTNGMPIETYSIDDVVGLARVFTGLSFDGGQSFFQRPGVNDRYRPLILFPNEHSALEKSFLGTTIAAETSGEESIDMTLDTLFAHPNVAPFISRLLIQRFTASSPNPAYVGRVAAAFELGQFTAPNGRVFGTRSRGDLAATLAAILLDPAFFSGASTQNDNFIKVREPVLRFVHWARAFGINANDVPNESRLNNTSDPAQRLGQHPFRAPSVFNFYSPGYIAPGTETGQNNLTAPEFQIANTSSLTGYINFMTDYVFDRTPSGGTESFTPNYNAQLALADTPQALVDNLALLLTGNRMSTITRSEIINTLNATPIRQGSEDDDRLRRVEVAVIMALASPAYAVIN